LKKVSARQRLQVRKNWTFRPGTGHPVKSKAQKFCRSCGPSSITLPCRVGGFGDLAHRAT
jgi:hypothetical protein